jgi:transcriptional regulator with XRE-family HTH domain
VPQGAYRQLRVLMHALKTARERQGLSLADVARQSGIDKGALSRLETGAQTNPTIDTIWRYAYALGKDLAWLVTDVAGDGDGTGEKLARAERALVSATDLLREVIGQQSAPSPASRAAEGGKPKPRAKR